MLLKAPRDLRPRLRQSVAADQPVPAIAHNSPYTGGVIADGFLVVIAERASEIEPVGRALLRNAKGLGVGDYDFGTRAASRSMRPGRIGRKWRPELIGAQRDVENGHGAQG